MNPFIRAAIQILIPVLTAVWIDLGAWAKAREEAKDNKQPLPDFDFNVAWPRYMTGLVGGVIAFATSAAGIEDL